MQTVGLIFGGKSPEHEVSLSSALGVLTNIDKNKYLTKEIFINKNGKFFSSPGILKKVLKGQTGQLKKYDFIKSAKNINIYFPILHGKGGEDGEIQGLIHSINKPFVGSDILASGLCLNKAMFKLVMKSAGIPQLKFEIFNFQEKNTGKFIESIKNVKREFQFPVFVKAASLGSSVGVYKVKQKKELEFYLEKASQFDLDIVVEEAVVCGREIEVSVLGNNYEDIQVANPGEVVPGADFYDYDDKYKNGRAQTIINTKLSQKVEKMIIKIAKAAYLLVGCEGMARVDFFLSKDNTVYLNEINTIPGFTPISMYPKMWEATGLSYKDLVTKLIELGLKRKK